MKRIFSFIWEVTQVIIIALAIVLPIRYFLFQPFFVSGQSMDPNFENGDYLIVDEISYRFRDPQRGEVIVFHYPKDPSQRYIKRVIGLPGEKVQVSAGKVYIEKEGIRWELKEDYLSKSQTPGDTSAQLGEDEYFVMGDNRFYSYDSRRWGVLPKKEIIGKVYLRVWPIESLDMINAPTY